MKQFSSTRTRLSADPIPPDTAARISQCAQRLHSHFTELSADLNSIHRHLADALIRASVNYSPESASYSDFLEGVLIHTGLQILRTIRDTARKHGEHEKFTDDQVNAWLEEELLPDSGNSTGTPTTTELNLPIIAERLPDVLGSLSKRNRKICMLLMEGKSLRDTAHSLGIKYATFRRRIWPPLRAYLRTALS